jgi:hypothetical protein
MANFVRTLRSEFEVANLDRRLRSKFAPLVSTVSLRWTPPLRSCAAGLSTSLVLCLSRRPRPRPKLRRCTRTHREQRHQIRDVPDSCPYGGSHKLTRHGIQPWRGTSCDRVLTPGPAALHNKTHPLRMILPTLGDHLASWPKKYGLYFSYRRLLAVGLKRFLAEQTVRSIKRYHRQVFGYGITARSWHSFAPQRSTTGVGALHASARTLMFPFRSSKSIVIVQPAIFSVLLHACTARLFVPRKRSKVRRELPELWGRFQLRSPHRSCRSPCDVQLGNPPHRTNCASAIADKRVDPSRSQLRRAPSRVTGWCGYPIETVTAPKGAAQPNQL